jgi:phosphatidylethanolamine/phosphatidyl-N-methylethanolamine N-methyltransferase
MPQTKTPRSDPNALFVQEAVADFESTASAFPSSRYLARAMAGPLRLERAATVAELGPGTGAITQALLEGMSPGATLIAFETNARFCAYLRKYFPDPRLRLVHAGAETLHQYLESMDCAGLDGVASSLSFVFLTETQRHDILGGVAANMARGAVFTQYQYLSTRWADQLRRFARLSPSSFRQLLRRHFRSVESEIVWRNLPPAVVFTCRL